MPRKTVNKRKTKTVAATKTVERKNVVTTSPSEFEVKKIIPLIIIIVIVAVLVLLRKELVVATVNGQPITRFALINQLEKKDGKTVLSSMVSEALVMQEAQKRHVSVSDADVKSEVSKIEKSVSGQGQNLDELLAQQGMTRGDLNDQVKIQLLLKKMVGNITISDKQVDDYISQNKDQLPQGTDETTLRSEVRQQLEQQALNDKIQTFVANLQKKANIQYLKNY